MGDSTRLRTSARTLLTLALVLPALGLLVAVPAVAEPRDLAGLADHQFAAVCGAPQPEEASCLSILNVTGTSPLATASAVPQGFGPGDLQAAYRLPTSTAGSGHTVAIIDAYDLPTAQDDLNTYRAKYGLPACGPGCFTKVNQNGGSVLPAANASWGQEIALDMDMVSAACPSCNILLVEASSSRILDLGAAVNTAVRLGAVAVSNSYGGPESTNSLNYDNFYNHPGVAITASAGDSGYGVSYPASSPYVTAVGGTSLTRDGSTRGFAESVWSGSGSGCSSVESKPMWQTDAGCSQRTVADVAAVADPGTGVAVFDSTPSAGSSGWLVVGGTSASAPLVAGVYALADTPAAGSNPASFPYAHPAGLNDVTSGSNGTCGSYLCTGGAGYDGPTGLGTPNGVSAFTATPTTSARYLATTPKRVADTRSGPGAISVPGGSYAGGPLAANVSYRFDLAAAGVQTAQAAYVFNVTAISPSGPGNLRVAPGSAFTPSTSLINYQPGKDVANLVIVPNVPGSNADTVQLYSAAASADVAIDLVGYYPATSAAGLSPAITSVTPSRVADTRAAGGTVAAGETRSFQVGGNGGVPTSGAKAVALNVTAISPAGLGNLRVFAHGDSRPLTSNINYIPGQDKSVFVIVNLPPSGVIDVYSAGATVNVALDAYASYDQAGSNLVTTAPVRAYDSRPNATLPAGGSVDVPVTAAGVPATAQAVLVSVTAIHTNGFTGVGNLRAYPTGSAAPNVSTLNYVSPTADVANFAIIPLGINGQITVNTQGTLADVTVDVLGYIPAT